MNDLEPTTAKVRELIEKHDGNISAVARATGVSRGTIYNRIESDPELDEVLHDAREKIIDEVERKLWQEAKAGNTAAMIFFLKTQGKKRGYIERQELTGADGGGLKIEVEYVNSALEAAETPQGAEGDSK